MSGAPVDRDLVGYRFVETQYGDTLQIIAAREMGDATRWPEIVSYNGLVPPFITDDEALAGPGVALSGQSIRIPAPAPISDATTNPNATFLSDIKLQNGLVEADSAGDMLLCEGLPNLKQALVHRVVTQRGELMYHPLYGSLLRRLIGTVNGPTANLLAAQYAKATVESDPRVSRVSKSTAQVSGDVINVSVEAETISGRSITIDEAI
jgi:phage baseplate assembly protein W